MKKMSKKATALAGLGVLAVVGGTFAYYNQTVSLENPLTTGKYENELIEDYTPPTEELKPGATLDKKVGAKNTGDYPVMVRIKMDEVWRRKDANGATQDIISHDSTKGDGFAAIEIGANGGYDDEFIATQYGDTENEPGPDADGQVNGDDSVVRKNLAEGYTDYWIYNPNDGYWYYNKILYKGDVTERNLLDSITLASNVDLGLYTQKDWYYIGDADTNKAEIDDKDWIEYKVIRDGDGAVTGIKLKDNAIADTNNDGFKAIADTNNDGFYDAIDMASVLGLGEDDKLFRKNESLLDDTAKGYADANYTLTITSQFVQATPDALTEAFGTEGYLTGLPQDIQDVINGINLDDLDLNPNETTAAAEG